VVCWVRFNVNKISRTTRILGQLQIRFSFLLTSWYLWQQLHMSVGHPIYKRIQKRYKYLFNAVNILYVIFIVGFVTLSGTVILFTSVDTAIIVTMPLILMVFSSSYIILWVYQITLMIGLERENRTLDNMSVTPVGELSIKWIMCIATIRHRDTLGWIELSRRIVIGIIWMLFTMAICLTISQISAVEISEVLAFVFNIVIFGVVIYVEHAQSILIGCLMAMWIPNILPARIDAMIGAILAYFTVQILTFVTSLSLGVFLQSSGHFDLNTLFNQEFFTISFIMFMLVREILILILWRVLAHQSNANPNVQLLF
jgi:hypothetical protein